MMARPQLGGHSRPMRSARPGPPAWGRRSGRRMNGYATRWHQVGTLQRQPDERRFTTGGDDFDECLADAVKRHFRALGPAGDNRLRGSTPKTAFSASIDESKSGCREDHVIGGGHPAGCVTGTAAGWVTVRIPENGGQNEYRRSPSRARRWRSGARPMSIPSPSTNPSRPSTVARYAEPRERSTVYRPETTADQGTPTD